MLLFISFLVSLSPIIYGDTRILYFPLNTGLYTTFIFQKPDPEIAPPIATPLLPDVSYNLDEVINIYYRLFYLDLSLLL